MSLDLLKEARAALAAGVSVVESLLTRHTAATNEHATVGNGLDLLRHDFAALLEKVDAAVAGLEAPAVPTVADLKAFIARM